MGIMKDIAVDKLSSEFERSEFERAGLPNIGDAIIEEMDRTFIEEFSEEKIVAPLDKIVLNTTLEEVDAPLDTTTTIIYPSKIKPAVAVRESEVEDPTEEELSEEEILQSSKRNRLRVNLTGGLATETAGTGVVKAGKSPAGTGLKVGA